MRLTAIHTSHSSPATCASALLIFFCIGAAGSGIESAAATSAPQSAMGGHDLLDLVTDSHAKGSGLDLLGGVTQEIAAISFDGSSAQNDSLGFRDRGQGGGVGFLDGLSSAADGDDFNEKVGDALGAAAEGSDTLSVSARGDEGKSICSSSGSASVAEKAALWDSVLIACSNEMAKAHAILSQVLQARNESISGPAEVGGGSGDWMDESKSPDVLLRSPRMSEYVQGCASVYKVAPCCSSLSLSGSSSIRLSVFFSACLCLLPASYLHGGLSLWS